MGKITGFLEIDRHDRKYAPVAERVKHYNEFVVPLSEKETRDQAARCMNCGIPYCHGTGSVAPGTPGCPVNNQIPDFNDLVYQNNWQEASRNLHSTNNFPEFTGRICPAPCEASCTLNIDDNPVTIKTIECAIVDRAWDNGWLPPEIAANKTGKKIAVVGSGPAGLACAQQLARAGHEVHVYEKFAKAGGLLRYGIPDFKMEKHVIDRRIAQMEAEGVVFHYGSPVGGNAPGALDPQALLTQYDAMALTGGAEAARDLPIPGRDLAGIHFAMDFLPQQNRRVSGEPFKTNDPILAGGKHVVVIGGGDTGSDCIGTSNRHGAASVTNFELFPMPPDVERNPVWPYWPTRLRTSSSHEEGVERDWSIATKSLVGEGGKVKALKAARLEWKGGKSSEIAGSEFDIPADLVLLAMGFVSPVQSLLEEFGVDKDARGNARASTDDALAYRTSVDKVFAAGDMRRGQSLVVWAIREGRQCARAVDEFLMGFSELPR